ncbi:myogenesis-regulating glycosidase-like [Dreissena polymorpha]|nr:myogenesis-regulating glycosidase-like [Dreissena polymorpha]
MEQDKPAKPERGVSKRVEQVLVFCMLVVLVATIGVVVWQTSKLNIGGDNNSKQPSEHKIHWPLTAGNLEIDNDYTLRLLNSQSKALKFSAALADLAASNVRPTPCNGTEWNYNICVEWSGKERLTVNTSAYFVPRDGSALTCYEVTAKALGCSNQVIQHCFNTSIAHWYGGYADKFQYWPFENNTRRLSVYVVNDSYVGDIGGVIERYFVASTGAGVLLDHDVPLYYSLNHPKQGLMCFVAKFDKYPYFNIDSELPVLKYKICESDNLKDVHMKMANALIDKPQGIPDKSLFKYPIWSTWAQYKKNINQSTVMEFANAILQHIFSHAQIEIDDDWTPRYDLVDAAHLQHGQHDKEPCRRIPHQMGPACSGANPTFHQEVRVGYRTQRYPICVRLMDKDSNWSHNNALKFVIPCVPTYGLLGYPFVLPDMIGGNAYNDHPDPELFVRWTQLNTFLPGMQYSIVPWIYNETIIDIVRKFAELREKISPTLIAKAEDAVRTGDPIILPLWWIDSIFF